MAINATDNEDLASQLWGQEKHWDDELEQFVPNDGKYTKGGDRPSPGNSSEQSSDQQDNSSAENESKSPSGAQMTGPSSNETKKDTSVAPSTGGSGTVKKDSTSK